MSIFTLAKDNDGIIKAISPKNISSTEKVRFQSSDTSKPSSSSTQKTVNAQSSSSSPSSKSIIDVVKNFDWKASPNNDIIEQPYILLKEYYVYKSSLAAQALYQLQATVESAIETGRIVNNVTPLQNVAAAAGIDTDSVLNKLREDAEASMDELKKFIGHGGDIGNNGIIDPYVGLYILKETDFLYKLPYFSSKHTQKNAFWESCYTGAGQTIITDLMNSAVDFVASFGTGIPIFGSLMEPGLYIERGKFYQPRPGTESISVSFPLLNTLNQESIQNNFDLIWLLVFQNSSFRKNKTEITPPCIYQVLIPGVKFMLYAYISDIKIEYLGTRRKILLNHPKVNTQISTMVPEAYNITITINSLTTDSGNFMLQSLRDTL